MKPRSTTAWRAHGLDHARLAIVRPGLTSWHSARDLGGANRLDTRSLGVAWIRRACGHGIANFGRANWLERRGFCRAKRLHCRHLCRTTRRANRLDWVWFGGHERRHRRDLGRTLWRTNRLNIGNVAWQTGVAKLDLGRHLAYWLWQHRRLGVLAWSTNKLDLRWRIFDGLGHDHRAFFVVLPRTLAGKRVGHWCCLRGTRNDARLAFALALTLATHIFFS